VYPAVLSLIKNNSPLSMPLLRPMVKVLMFGFSNLILGESVKR
jgi:hypothetical protein